MDKNVGYYEAGQKRVITSAYGITKDLLSSFSPDINSIENGWHMLKSHICKCFTRGEHQSQTEDESCESLSEQWERIVQSTWDRLIDSMSERVVAVARALRTHTKW